MVLPLSASREVLGASTLSSFRSSLSSPLKEQADEEVEADNEEAEEAVVVEVEEVEQDGERVEFEVEEDIVEAGGVDAASGGDKMGGCFCRFC